MTVPLAASDHQRLDKYVLTYLTMTLTSGRLTAPLTLQDETQGLLPDDDVFPEPTLGRLVRSGDALKLPALLTEGTPALESDGDMSRRKSRQTTNSGAVP